MPSLRCVSFFSFPFFSFLFSFLPSTRNCSAIIPRPECSTFRQLFPSSHSRAMSETTGEVSHISYTSERKINSHVKGRRSDWCDWERPLVPSFRHPIPIFLHTNLPHRGCAVESGYKVGHEQSGIDVPESEILDDSVR